MLPISLICFQSFPAILLVHPDQEPTFQGRSSQNTVLGPEHAFTSPRHLPEMEGGGDKILYFNKLSSFNRILMLADPN